MENTSRCHMRVYLAGPMSGIPKFNFPAFDFAARKLRNLGFEVFSPAEHDRSVDPRIEDNATGDAKQAEAQTGFTLRKALGADTAWICAEGDAIALLPGWEKSSGVSAELPLAKALGLSILTLGKEFDINA